MRVLHSLVQLGKNNHPGLKVSKAYCMNFIPFFVLVLNLRNKHYMQLLTKFKTLGNCNSPLFRNSLIISESSINLDDYQVVLIFYL